MNIKVNETLLIEKLKEFQKITGQTASYIYSKYIHPFIVQVVNLHIYNVPKLYIDDARQNVYILILKRLRRIDFDTIIIKNVKNYFFIMVKRLVLNELEKIKNRKNKELLLDNFDEIANSNVFIYELDDDM